MKPGNIYMIKVKVGLRWAGHIVRKGKIKFMYMILVGKPERKKHFRRRQHILQDIIKLDLQ